MQLIFSEAVKANDPKLLNCCHSKTGSVAAINAQMGICIQRPERKVYWNAAKNEFTSSAAIPDEGSGIHKWMAGTESIV